MARTTAKRSGDSSASGRSGLKAVPADATSDSCVSPEEKIRLNSNVQKCDTEAADDPTILVNCRKALAVFDNLDMAVYVSDPVSYDILYVNQTVERRFGSVVGEKCYRAFHKKKAPCPFCTNDIILNKKPDQPHTWEFYNQINRRWYRCIDKAIQWIDGRTVRYEMAVDITDLKRTEAALQESEARYRTILEEIEDGYYEVDLDGRLTFVNDALCRALGYTQSELAGMHYGHYTDAKDREKIYRIFSTAYQTGKPAQSFDWEIFRKDGKRMSVEASASLIHSADGTAAGFRGIVRDISVRKRAEEMLKRQSFQDGLTGLANRRCFDEDLLREMRRARRDRHPLSLMLSDIDFFKQFNDTYGHLKGDDCLKQVASTLARAVKRPGDRVARYGGEEFATILPETDDGGAHAIAERQRRNVEDLNIIHRKSAAAGVVTVSTGIATVNPTAATRPEMIIAVADQALYRAKSAGRNRVAMITMPGPATAPDISLSRKD